MTDVFKNRKASDKQQSLYIYVFLSSRARPIHESYWQADFTYDNLSNNETARTLPPPEVGSTQKLSLRDAIKRTLPLERSLQ